MPEQPTETAKPMPKLLLLGLARDCSGYISNFLSFLEDLRKARLEAFAVIGENGSADDTRRKLSSAAANGAPLRIVDTGIMSREHKRLERMAVGREYLKSEAGHELSTADFVGVVDIDNVMKSPPDAAAVLSALSEIENSSDIFGVAASSRPFYYDLYALRCADYDFADLHTRIQRAKGNPLTYYWFMRKNVFEPQKLLTKSSAEKCTSAFNGLCFYKASDYSESSYIGSANALTCEHVILNQRLHDSTGKYISISNELSITTPPEHMPQSWMTFHALRIEKMVGRLRPRPAAKA